MKKTAFALILILVLLFSAVIVTLLIRSTFQTCSNITIESNGDIEGTRQIQRCGNTYTLLADLSCTIYVQRSDIVIDGAGYAVKGNGEGSGIDLSNECWRDSSRAQIRNVTVKNLKLVNWFNAIEFVASVNDTFIDNYVADSYCGFNIWWTHNHTLLRNTIENCIIGITISFGGSGNVITKNNIMNSSVGVMMPPESTVDRNYWSDYLTRYPNATEIGDSGVWDTPYEGRLSLHEGWYNFIDNNPLVEPIALNPEFTNEEPFPTAKVTLFIGVLVIIVSLCLIYNKRKSVR